MLGVGFLMAVDVIIIAVYMVVQGLMGSLEARLANYEENPEDVEGVRTRVNSHTMLDKGRNQN